jgi:two-component system LytT family sensor kinase
MLTSGAPGLLHLVGFITGAALYTMLLVMAAKPPARADRLALATALLGVTWNLGELAAYVAREMGIGAVEPWLMASSFTALGLLAAVVVHSVARRRRGTETGLRPALANVVAGIAYSCAVLAGLLHLAAARVGQPLPSSAGLTLLTAGLTTLIVPLVIMTSREANSRRALWMAALAIFAVSALHLARFHATPESWPVELIGHHASILLAFAILYQDYRFALADLFLKQALTLLALVALVFGGYSAVEPLLAPAADARSAMAIGALLSLWIGTALLFPVLHRLIRRFVDRVVLARADYGALVERLAEEVQHCDSVEAVLDRACTIIAPALTATAATCEARSLQPGAPLAPNEVAVWTAEAPHYVLIVGQLAGGRRLLSDDLTMLDRVTVILARRIDALRLTEERYERMLREREVRTLATEAELRALRAQVNPHFLFNALTTIGYLIQSAPPRALQTLLRLTTLLRSVLRSEGEFTTLGRERELIECYLQIERERFEERLEVRLEIPEDLREVPIPSLIVQPLVENAIKHGIAMARGGGAVSITAHLDTSRPRGHIVVAVRNTGAPLRGRRPASDSGVGLKNVERRLRHYYGEEASLTIGREADGATIAELRLPAIEADEPDTAPIARNVAL